MNGLVRAIDATARASFVLAGLALVAIVGVTCWEVLLRYAFNAPTRWGSDTVNYLLAATLLLALPEVTRRGGHVSISLLVDALPSRSRRTAGRALALIAAIACVAVAAITADEVARQLDRGVRTLGAVPIPKAWITGLIVWGFGATGIVFLRHAITGPPGLPTADVAEKTGP